MSLSKIAPKQKATDRSRLSLPKSRKKKAEEERFRLLDEETIAGIFNDNENPTWPKVTKRLIRFSLTI